MGRISWEIAGGVYDERARNGKEEGVIGAVISEGGSRKREMEKL